MKILLTADEAAGLRVLRLLINSSHEIAAVITPEKNSAIRNTASRSSVPVMEPSNLNRPSFADQVRESSIDVLLNVHLLYIIHPEIIGAVRTGAFNLHPGPLPHYAGLHTPGWAIYNREKEYGVTLHWLDEGIDTGKIAYKAPVSVQPDETGFSLSVKCATKGIKLISRLLNDLSSDPSAIPRIPQDLSCRTYFKNNERPQKGYVNWSKPSAEIDAFIRAFNYSPFKSPWGLPKTTRNGSEIAISSTNLTYDPCDKKPGTVELNGKDIARVATRDYWLTLKPCNAEGKPVPVHSVLKNGDILR